MTEIYSSSAGAVTLVGNAPSGSGIYYKDATSGKMYFLANLPSDQVPTSDLDMFGIKMINPSKVGGRVFNAPFTVGNNRTLTSGQRDGTSDMIPLGSAKYIINTATGEMQFNGDVPRLYIYDSTRSKLFENVEITAYYKMISHTSAFASGYQGFEIGNRGEHEKGGTSARVYYTRHALGGTWYRMKEDIHPKSYDVTVKTGVPFDTGVWYGMKMVVRTQGDGSVRIQSYRDTSDGQGGGVWTQMSDFTDTGSNWQSLPVYKPSTANCGCHSTFFRSDNVTDFRIKKVSIREI